MPVSVHVTSETGETDYSIEIEETGAYCTQMYTQLRYKHKVNALKLHSHKLHADARALKRTRPLMFSAEH